MTLPYLKLAAATVSNLEMDHQNQMEQTGRFQNGDDHGNCRENLDSSNIANICCPADIAAVDRHYKNAVRAAALLYEYTAPYFTSGAE